VCDKRTWMTLVLTSASIPEVLQLSDRRVSRLSAGIFSLHSSVENKTVIFRVRDAVGSLGYTGDAYVGSEPTDQWLAGLIVGQSFGGVQFSVRMGRWRLPSLNTVIWRISHALAQGAILPSGSLTVCLAGYRDRRSYTIPFIAEVRWSSARNEITSRMRLPRQCPAGIYFSQIGDIMTGSALQDAMARGAANSSQPGHHPQIGAMIEAIRTRASQSQLVGADLMAVQIPHPSHRLINWRFIPAAPHNAILNHKHEDFVLQNAFYSPWIVMPGAIHAPSVGTSHWEVVSADWTVRCLNEQPSPTGPLLFASSSQRRVSRPR
jgi:hypothetical protein